jgi:peptide deformylase
MQIHPSLVMVPDPRLRQTCVELTKKGDELTALISLMREVMTVCRDAGVHAVAIAAPQVGVLERLIVIESQNFDAVVINPVILKSSGTQKNLEGCLSFPPGTKYEVERPDLVKFRYIDQHGFSHTQKFHGFYAAVILHEIDHLDGILMDDNGMPR